VYNGQTSFVRSTVARLGVTGATLVFAGVTYGSYRALGWTWITWSLALATLVLGTGGIAETLLERVVLTPEGLVVRRLWGTRVYPVAAIQEIRVARGVAPALLLRDGRWVKLPELGMGFGNSVRAWLRANGRAGVAEEPA
jgi:hypothetical protein